MVLYAALAATGCASGTVDPTVAVTNLNPPCSDRVKAKVTRAVMPEKWSNRFWRGKYAVVDALVTPDGSVSQVKAYEGNDVTLMRILMEFAPQWQFAPGSCHGAPEQQHVLVTVDCRPEK